MSIFLGPLSRTGNWFSFPHIRRGLAGHLGGNRKSGARGLTSSRMRPRPLVSLPFYPVIDSARPPRILRVSFSLSSSLSLSLSFFSSPKNRGRESRCKWISHRFFLPFLFFLFRFKKHTKHFLFLVPFLFFFLIFFSSKYRATVRVPFEIFGRARRTEFQNV